MIDPLTGLAIATLWGISRPSKKKKGRKTKRTVKRYRGKSGKLHVRYDNLGFRVWED